MDTLIVGAGGHGRVVLEILLAAGTHTPIGFIDADPALAGTEVAGLPVFGHVNALARLRHRRISAAIIAIGDNAARLTYAKALRDNGFELINAIHPSAVISPSAKLGCNTVIAANAVVGTDCRLGDSVIVNTSAVIDHECEIGEGAHICPDAALAGRVRIGEKAFVGLGARVIPCMSVGNGAVIGAGAVVIRDIPPFATAVGVPARIIRSSAQPIDTAMARA